MEMPKINIGLHIKPELTLIVGDETLGRIQFKNINELKEFIPKLKDSLGALIKEFRDKEEELVKLKR